MLGGVKRQKRSWMRWEEEKIAKEREAIKKDRKERQRTEEYILILHLFRIIWRGSTDRSSWEATLCLVLRDLALATCLDLQLGAQRSWLGVLGNRD